MKWLIAVPLAFLVTAQEKWEVKPPYAEKTKLAMEATLDVDYNGMKLPVSATAEIYIGKVSEKEITSVVALRGLEVDGQPMGSDVEMNMVLNKRGFPVSTDSEFGDAARRMLMGTLFVYPETSLSVGDKWSFQAEDAKKTKLDYEVVGTEKLGEVMTLKISMKMKETGDEPMTGEGNYWLRQDGKVQKLDVSVKNWPIPQVGGIGSVHIVAKIKA